jgi:CheY-like chemotaxis protein
MDRTCFPGFEKITQEDHGSSRYSEHGSSRCSERSERRKIRGPAYGKYAVLRIYRFAFPTYICWKMKVLIVDDNQNVRELLRNYLPKSVDTILECEDGTAAFELYDKHHPDWVLMDWEMPKVDGIIATRRIIAKFPKAHICMVTAFDDDDLKQESLKAGAKEFVPKDNLNELRMILSRGLNY